MKTKTERLMLKLTPGEKALIEKGAREAGLSMTAFVILLVKNWGNGVRFERRNRD